MEIYAPESYIGKFILLYAHGKDKRPIYIETELFKVTGLRGKLQLLLSAPDGTPASKGFTRLGDHIAAVFDNEALGRRAVSELPNVIAGAAEIEINFKKIFMSAPAGEHVLKTEGPSHV